MNKCDEFMFIVASASLIWAAVYAVSLMMVEGVHKLWKHRKRVVTARTRLKRL